MSTQIEKGTSTNFKHEAKASSSGLSVIVDYERYERFLEDADLSEDQKHEFLQTLWGIVVSFIDLGFGVHPAQQAKANCGQGEKTQSGAPKSAKNTVSSKHIDLNSNFDDASKSVRVLGAGGLK